VRQAGRSSFGFLEVFTSSLLFLVGAPAAHAASQFPPGFGNWAEHKYEWVTAVWSPDHEIQARIDVAELIGTPAGSNSCLYLGSRPVYPSTRPKDCLPHPKGIYDGVHTFLTSPEWSPDSRKVAVVVRVFDWEYTDPFGKYWEGTLSKDRYFLAIASMDQPTLGYALKSVASTPHLQWQGNSRLALDGQVFDLDVQPPASIP
jgi:hypothetical protein